MLSVVKLLQEKLHLKDSRIVLQTLLKKVMCSGFIADFNLKSKTRKKPCQLIGSWEHGP